MKRILVSLVSEQTVPNILAACYWKPDILWFVSTKRMEEEQRTRFILDTLAMKGIRSTKPMESVIVDQDSPEDCVNKIERLVDADDGDSEYAVNITGGNKVMALAAYEVFRDTGRRVTVHYIPLGKNELIQVFPRKKPLKVLSVKERLNLPEYLSAYGFAVANLESIMRAKEKAQGRRRVSDSMPGDYEQIRDLLTFFYSHLRDHRKKTHYSFSAEFDRPYSPVESDLLKKLGFNLSGKTIEKELNKDEIGFLTGGWLEECVFNAVHDLKIENLVDDVQTGVQITSSGGTSNELDIAFMKNNVFFHIECKSLGNEKEPTIVRDELYKKGALSTLLGKGDRRAFICTTLSHIKGDLVSRGRDYGLEILDIDEVRRLKSILAERLSA